MAFPKIDACLVCEGVRPELQNKSILLGFFGIAPYVQVLLRDFNLPGTLCFVFCGAGGSGGKYDVSLRLTDPQGRVISNPQTSPDIRGGELAANRSTSNIFMTFHGPMGQPGKYNVTLVVNGSDHYSTAIDILPMPGQPLGMVH